MKILTRSSITLISLISFGLAACSGGEEEGSSVASAGGSGGPTQTNTNTDPQPDDDNKPAGYQLDKDVEGDEDQMLVKVIFGGGGAGDNCVKWDVTVGASDGLELVKKVRNEKGDDVKEVDGDLHYTGKTVGGRDGAKALALKGDKLKLKGKMTNCDGSKSIDVDIVKPVGKLSYYTPVAFVMDNGKFSKDSGLIKIVIKELKVKKKKKNSGSECDSGSQIGAGSCSGSGTSTSTETSSGSGVATK